MARGGSRDEVVHSQLSNPFGQKRLVTNVTSKIYGNIPSMHKKKLLSKEQRRNHGQFSNTYFTTFQESRQQ
jgi:hypothetical protein